MTSRAGAAATTRTRPATPDDAEAAVALLRASITELCVADHRNDPASLECWLSNKTPAIFSRWLEDPRSFFVVAEVDAILCGVGLIWREGDLRLCYVQPGRQRSGVGRALLAALEAQARAWRVRTIRLHSTDGARPFYEAHGYTSKGPAETAFGVVRHYPYEKVIGSGLRSG